MMRVSEQGLELIKRFEGFSATPYICAGGKLTIGYGHVIQPNEDGQLAEINENYGMQLLRNDIASVGYAIDKYVDADINQMQFDALACFIYNIGTEAFSRSTLLKYLNKCDYLAAAAEFDRWVYAKGKKLSGLMKRRAAEKALFLQNPQDCL